MKPATATETLIRVHDDPADVDASAWNALLSLQPSPTPFMRHEYLAALHRSASATPRTGWAPQWLTLHRGDALIAGCALYLKSHSYGEYVFDWAWADAYERHGLAYYPKLLGAVPFTPVAGTRLLARDDQARQSLLHAIGTLADRSQLSSSHLLFVDQTDRAALEHAGWLVRDGVQFHWHNREPSPYASFDEFAHGLQRDKRKKIAQERRRVADAGITFTVHEGASIDAALWDFFHRCYTLTYRAHGSTPYLTRAFFGELARTMPQMWLMFVAWRKGTPIASSLIAIDTERGHAWGRYWGSTEFVPCLHFEACYYQPLQWCIERRFHRFEGGAQGEHKMARGLLPVHTASAHRLADPRFASAVADFLQREGAGIGAYVDELRERNPFR
jgi:predicted N-acyltransferase